MSHGQGYGISSSHVWVWELDCKEGWALKNWCFRIVVLEKIREHPLHSKEIKPVSPKGNQPWIFIRRSDTEAEAPILWPPEAETICWKRPWCWERLKAGGEGDDREWDSWMASSTQWTWVWATLGAGDGQGGLACYSPWGHKESTQLSNWWTELN